MHSMLTVIAIVLIAQLDRPQGDHPKVFVTANDLPRVQRAATTETGSRWADQLVEKAQSVKLSDLPALDRNWWDIDRTKPWGETYPQVFHHTWIVPGRWAELARHCAWGGVLRPDTKLTDKARQVLLSLADFTFEFEHYDVGMNYTVWVLEALEAYDLLYNDFSAAERQKIDGCFQRYLAALQKNDDFWLEHQPGGAINNHYAWHKLGLLAMGLFYDSKELVTQALDGPKGIEFLMQYGFTDNGLWTEGSIPYQMAATIPLVKAAELLENTGHERRLYRDDSGDGRALKDTYDALLTLLLPDRTLPTIGDCYGRRPHLGRGADWEILTRRFADPHYAWLLGDIVRRSPEALLQGLTPLPAGMPPDQRSQLWPEHGYAALRTVEGTDYWSGRGWSLFATYSHNRVHENLDKLSIILFADGHLWLPDCEATPSAEHSFSADIQRELNRETLCHNTLLVDQGSQQFPNRPLALIEYQVMSNLKRLTIGDPTGQLYPGVSQMRTCLVRDEYVLDFFQVQSATPHDFDWLLHIDAEAEEDSTLQPLQAAAFSGSTAWNYLRSPRRLGESTTYGAAFRQGKGQFRVDVLASWSQEIIGCGFPRDDRTDGETIPMRIFRSRQQTHAWYAALYRSGPGATEPIRWTVEPGELGNWQVTLSVQERRFLHRIPQLQLTPSPITDSR